MSRTKNKTKKKSTPKKTPVTEELSTESTSIEEVVEEVEEKVEVPIKTPAKTEELGDDELISIDHFRSEVGTDDANVRWTMYYYAEYRIATKEVLNELMDAVPVVKLILDKVIALPVAVRTIDDALKIINIIEGR